MKPFLILQLRPETEVSDNEFQAILDKAGLDKSDVHRIRLDQEAISPELDLDGYSGVIVGGGPGCVSDPEDQKTAVEKTIEAEVMQMMPRITAQDIPFLGCCYGIGILAHYLGARVDKSRYGEEVGTTACWLTPEGKTDGMLAGLPGEFRVFVGHKEAAQELPQGCTHLIAGPDCPFQMIRYKDNVYATQFHPEADGDVFTLRVNYYLHKGYFPPEDAARIIANCKAADAGPSAQILRNFVTTYAQP